MSDESSPPFLTTVNESLDIFASMFCSLTYGIALALYGIVVQSLHRRLRRPSPGRHKVALITLIYTTFAIICATAWFGITHYITQMAYVFHRDDMPGGPLVYEIFVLFRGPSYLVSIISMALLDWLAMGVQIWRLWILWRHSTYFFCVIALPVCLLLACIGVDIAVAVHQANINWLNTRAVEYSFAIGFAFFGIPPAATIIVTVFMVSRLGFIRRRHVDAIGRSDPAAKQYTGVIAMLIESYALDALWSIAIIATYALNSPLVWVVFVNSYLNVKIIALFLIVYRVVKGRAWQGHTERQLSTWQCNENHASHDPEASELELTTIQPPSVASGTA